MASSHQVVGEVQSFADTRDVMDTPIVTDGATQINESAKMPSWQEIRNSVRLSRKMHAKFANRIPHNFVFVPLETTCHSQHSLLDKKACGTRVLFLGVLPGQRENTLLYVDVPAKHSSDLLDFPAVWKPVLGYSQVASNNTERYSKEEELLRERKRLSVHGITSYQVSSDFNRLVFPVAGSLYTMKVADIGMTGGSDASEVLSQCKGCRLDPKLSLNDSDLVAFVHENDIWVAHISSGSERRLTFAHKGGNNNVNDPISAGTACYIIQEEFDRYSGYWWQPNNPPGVHRILYELVDESNVEVLHISNPLSASGVDSYRYPKAGTVNATVSLQLLEFSSTKDGQISEPIIKKMSEPLRETFPWMEYIVRVDWLRSGKGVWTQLLDRKQQRTAIVYIPLSKFDVVVSERTSNPTTGNCSETDVEMRDPSHPVSQQNGLKILYEETSDIWINVHDAFHFLASEHSDEVSFIWASENTGHRHLYHIRCYLKKPNRSKRYSTGDLISNNRTCASTITQLTFGDWEVLEQSESVWVDELSQMVYFMALKDSPLESHLYSVSYTDPGNPVRLTSLGASHAVAMSKNCQQFVTVASSIKQLYSGTVYTLSPRPMAVVNLLEPQGFMPDYEPPQLFSFNNSHGDLLHGLYHKPRNIQPGKKYPTVLYIYGGPHVQLVTNSFKGLRYQRLYTLSMLGYVVVAIDGRGSPHRGIQFESIFKHKMGQVEVSDQVEGLQELAKKVDFIDLNRVAIHGWSYGGYLSLMALAQRPDVFKVAIAGAPVVAWQHYDTGYTERYMDTPEANPTGYDDGSVLRAVSKLPNEPNRLLIVHGLIDENVHFLHTAHLVNALVKNCKPYHLQVYPGERHGIRRPDSNEHFEVVVISFLQQHL